MNINKKKQMEECDHLFIKQREGYWVGGFNSSDYEYTPCVVECLRCGLTNSYLVKDNDNIKHAIILKNIVPELYDLIELNNRVFKSRYHEAYGFKGRFNEDALNLISQEAVCMDHPRMLYHLAKIIKEDGTNEEIFEIMKTLNEIETTEEKVNLSKEQAERLLERYKSIKKKELSHQR